MIGDSNEVRLGRRAFLRNGVLTIAAAATAARPWGAAAEEQPPALRIGLMTDLHYADKAPAGNRFYRETLDKLAEAASRFERDRPAFLVELGDLIDAAESVEVEKSNLKTIDRAFSAICEDRHYVLGNHCVDVLTKAEFLGEVGRKESAYSFDRGGFHFIILDACFRADGEPYGRKNAHWTDANLPPAELDWLAEDLKAADAKTIVFAHQRLDVNDSHGVKNAPDARKILEASGKVLAVFQGHSHQNDLNEIGGIPYCTLAAMVEGTGVESNGYSLLTVDPDGSLHLAGFRRQASHDWPV